MWSSRKSWGGSCGNSPYWENPGTSRMVTQQEREKPSTWLLLKQEPFSFILRKFKTPACTWGWVPKETHPRKRVALPPEPTWLGVPVHLWGVVTYRQQAPCGCAGALPSLQAASAPTAANPSSAGSPATTALLALLTELHAFGRPADPTVFSLFLRMQGFQKFPYYITTKQNGTKQILLTYL